MAEILRRTDEVDDPIGMDIRMDGGEVDATCPACGEGRMLCNKQLERQCDQCGYIESAFMSGPAHLTI
jgi:uncharacterized protein (DUF983 family)